MAGSPMAWVLAFVFVVHLVGIGWGLPASDGWDNDGVAPRDFLPGLAATFTPGSYYTYPPVHLALLALLTLPVSIVAVLRAPSLSLHAVIGEIIRVPYMTAIALVARSVSLVMSVGIALFLGRMAEELRAHALGVSLTDARVKRVGVVTALVAGLDASLTYYAHTSNLDVPYLFWSAWALLHFTRAITRREPQRFRQAFALAVLAVGTKDQAYALFALSLPAALSLWAVLDPWARTEWKRIVRDTAIAVAWALGLFLVADAVLFNPTGFLARLRFLSGTASQDFVEYEPGWKGRYRIVADAAAMFDFQYPTLFALVIVIGIVVVGLRAWKAPRRGASVVASLAPFLAAFSFTVMFNFTARRTNARFLLPQALALSVYAGSAIDALAFGWSSRPMRAIGKLVATVAVACAVYLCVSVDATLLGDPRYAAEAWLEEHVAPGDVVETYGLNVYLPRFPASSRVLRVGPEPVDKRNPIPGIEEVQGPFNQARARGARYIVVSTGWVWRYIARWPSYGPGRQKPPVFQRSTADKQATDWFDGLVAGDQGYKLVREFSYDDRFFRLVDVHGSSGKMMWIYERAE
jgi:hypothetical protein